MRTTKFFRAVQAEWIKKKGSFAAWLVIVGGLFYTLNKYVNLPVLSR